MACEGQCDMSPQMNLLDTRIQRLEGKVDEIGSGLAGVGTKVARVETLLEASLDRNSDERNALFKARLKHEERISSIERDYVPKSEHTKARDEMGQELRAVNEKVAGLQTKMAQFLGVITVLWAIVQVAVKFLWK